MEELQPEVPLHQGVRPLQAAGPEDRDLPGEEAAVHQGAAPAPAEAAQSITVTTEKRPFLTEEAENIEADRDQISFGLLLQA